MRAGTVLTAMSSVTELTEEPVVKSMTIVMLSIEWHMINDNCEMLRVICMATHRS